MLITYERSTVGEGKLADGTCGCISKDRRPTCIFESIPLMSERKSSIGGVQGEAVLEMRVGLSQPKCRLWLQTGSSCDG
jgi:hypothetical protein